MPYIIWDPEDLSEPSIRAHKNGWAWTSEPKAWAIRFPTEQAVRDWLDVEIMRANLGMNLDYNGRVVLILERCIPEWVEG